MGYKFIIFLSLCINTFLLRSIWSWIKDFQVAFGITLSVVLGIYIVFGKSPFASIHRHSVDKLEKF